MIIDVHTHLNNYHEERTLALEESLDLLRANMEKNRVDVAGVLTSYRVDAHRPSTRDVVHALRDDPSLYVVAGVSYTHYRESDLREIAEYLKEGKVRGLKIYPGYEPFYPWDTRMRVVFDLCLEFDVPLMVHTGDTYSPGGKLKYAHPLNIDELAVDNPGLKIVICHMGNPWFRDCMEVVYKNHNVYADISGLVLGNFDDRFELWLKQQLEEIILYAGEPRYLLFGTDWPISSMESYVDFMKRLEMPPVNKDRILYQNAAKLFRIPLPAHAHSHAEGPARTP
jgi:predicted TIM-barrel fold metal-dependent hydrolase